ncbi:MAG: substrate-binding domain-containing protein [Candidatus Hydrogenedens sp.]|nr:substrate-binding domain-containing protein [Candidatus Hydrogenedens sp.]
MGKSTSKRGAGESRVPTLRDVAEKASVNVSTASIILGGGERAQAYSPKTRERVELAARELGYAANFFAKALRQSRTRLIGAVVFSEQSPYYGRPLHGLRAYAEEKEYQVVTADMGYKPERLAECVSMLSAWKVEAMVLMTGGQLAGPEVVEVLRRSGIPYVIGGLNLEHDSSSHLVFNNYKAGELLAQHALELGHRSIGILAASATNRMSEERLCGLNDRLQSQGIGTESRHLLRLGTADLTVRAGMESARALLVSHPEITMLICHSDIVAIGALHAARNAGLAIPKDISVTGFDDICLHEVGRHDERLGEFLTPSLTTVRVPQVEMGREVGKLLVDMIEHPGQDQLRRHIEFFPELIVRNSTGPAPLR